MNIKKIDHIGIAVKDLSSALKIYIDVFKLEIKKIEEFKQMEYLLLDDELDYINIPGLSNEAVEKLLKVKPLSIGQVLRMQGLRYTDVQLLVKYGKNALCGTGK